mmetsp:Transcript_116177/g.324915  ORF Transcript_116177/g.324915 Transcript_116177/m.324915 type:complete len:251 (-) Transcript_116177:297-1049(-)
MAECWVTRWLAASCDTRHSARGHSDKCSMHRMARALSVAVTLRRAETNCSRSHWRILGAMGSPTGSSATRSSNSSCTALASRSRTAATRRKGMGGSRSVSKRSKRLCGGYWRPRTASIRTPRPKHSEPKHTSASRNISRGMASTRSTKTTTAPAAPPRSLCQSTKSRGPAMSFCCCAGAPLLSSGHQSLSSPSPSAMQARSSPAAALVQEPLRMSWSAILRVATARLRKSSGPTRATHAVGSSSFASCCT